MIGLKCTSEVALCQSHSAHMGRPSPALSEYRPPACWLCTCSLVPRNTCSSTEAASPKQRGNLLDSHKPQVPNGKARSGFGRDGHYTAASRKKVKGGTTDQFNLVYCNQIKQMCELSIYLGIQRRKKETQATVRG